MNRKPAGKPLVEVLAEPFIRAESFQCVSFFDETQKRQVIVLYSLGEDGIIREFTGGKWQAFPIKDE